MADDIKTKENATAAAIKDSPKDLLGGPQSPPTQPATPAARPSAPSDAERMAVLERAVVASYKSGSAGPTPDLDKTVPGGKYRVGDQWLNADGEELNEDGTLMYPGRQVKDVYGRLTTVRGK